AALALGEAEMAAVAVLARRHLRRGMEQTAGRDCRVGKCGRDVLHAARTGEAVAAMALAEVRKGRLAGEGPPDGVQQPVEPVALGNEADCPGCLAGLHGGCVVDGG